MSKYNIESFYRQTLKEGILSNQAVPFTQKVSATPTLSSGFLTISPNTENEEIIYYNSKDDIAKTINVLYRGIKPSATELTTAGVDYNNTSYYKPHSIEDAIRGDINNIHINQNSNLAGDNTFSGTQTFNNIVVNNQLTIPRFATTAARDAAIPSPVNGMECYVTGDGVFYDYQGGAWVSRATGTTPNATQTVSGKVELATDAEITAGTDIGGTGASLVATPSQLKKSISLTNAATSLADTDEIAVNISGENKRITKPNLKETLSASETEKGTVERATNAEAISSTDTGRYVSPAHLRYITGLKLTTSSQTITQGGTTQSFSAGAQSIKGGIVTTIRNYEGSASINPNVWGIQFSSNGTDWTTMYTETYTGGAAQNSRFTTPSFLLNAGHYYRVFAGGTGSATVDLTVTAILQEAD